MTRARRRELRAWTRRQMQADRRAARWRRLITGAEDHRIMRQVRNENWASMSVLSFIGHWPGPGWEDRVRDYMRTVPYYGELRPSVDDHTTGLIEEDP